MKQVSKVVAVLLLMTAVGVGCSIGDEITEQEWCDDSGGKEGEEPGMLLALDETHDDVRGGARLMLSYDAESNSFKGTVENVTEYTLEQVRVEVHLSNQTELGPTSPTDLESGEIVDVELAATDAPFACWTAHAEVGSEEHHDGGDEEHGGGEEGSGEHEGGD